MASTMIIRCPICLASQTVSSSYPADKRIHCGNCDRDFTLGNALTASNTEMPNNIVVARQSEPTINMQMEIVQTRNPIVTWLFGLIMLLMIMSYARPFMATLRGPGFLLFFAIILVVTLFGINWLRKAWEDSLHVTLITLILFESLGVLRYIDGSATGLHRFTIMFIMMAVGGILIFARAEYMANNSSSGGCSGCSSSCSGCGGGCGGCGGCGG